MINRDGFPFIIAAAVVAILPAWLIHPYTGIPGLAACLFCINFFRDPEREIPPGDVAVSPADGKVVAVRRLDNADPPYAWFISIFMNVFNVHVNRAPVSGRIEAYRYASGKFLPANREAATIENEHNEVVLVDGTRRVRMSQVAGLIARRIVFWKQTGDTIIKGERIGLIRFGSRVDVWLPAAAAIKVGLGQKVTAGQTILAEFTDGCD
ncbi:MAG TPA: phosphatidylserine decarboxylase family protein [Acidobacteriota bacterium]|nr:phosphatidylserine decarboxylase family protein [Acidobacteriota bacterium]HQF87173.1 phosphatidylserine decarboxylase family protein [Acidobacteriota bacterium]HQG91734.1 phosphatidylserine decarboxylase family protein [Acidobacteriota bacterium]HQK86135.1 phosphatidylserine decarboxylase family protein [Acidobacteriota bacterium]